MSKNNMLLGYARGKVGSLVFSRLKGQQITKAHNSAPANPKTFNQMIQRIVLACGVALYKLAVSKFFKFAYEDKKTVESDYNAFIRRNISKFPYVTKTNVNQGVIPVGELVVSSGSLGSFAVTLTELTSAPSNLSGGLLYQGTDFSPLFASLTTSDNTVAKISVKIIAAGGGRIQDGDLITLVTFRNASTGDVQTSFGYSQFKIDTADSTSVGTDGKCLFFVGDPGDGNPDVFLYTGFLDANADTIDALASALIITRKEGSAILASDSTLQLNAAMTAVYNSARNAAARSAAAQSYGATAAAILNPDKLS